MLQRIQSIYLLLAAISMAVAAFCPIMNLIDNCMLYPCGIIKVEELIKPTWGIISIVGLSALLSFITIFLYKKRKKQISCIYVNILIILFYYITTLVYLLSYYNNIGFEAIQSFSYGGILPILALIFLVLAKIAIGKDEKLVKSLDRIR